MANETTIRKDPVDVTAKRKLCRDDVVRPKLSCYRQSANDDLQN